MQVRVQVQMQVVRKLLWYKASRERNVEHSGLDEGGPIGYDDKHVV